VLGARDEPVTIRQLEGVVAAKAFQNGYVRARPPRRRRNRRVAVVGSGPGGLAVADLLNRAGFHVVVFDREPKAGGILRYGIPDFKLEKRILDRRLRLLQEEGVAFELSVEVGRDLSFRYLRTRFDAVCLACGAREPRDLAVPGRDLQGIRLALDYLIRQNRVLAGEPVPQQSEMDAAGKDVVILGGGDTGADCLGTALRQNARRVTQLEILPKPPLTRPEETPWPMWPNVLRESSSHKEGGERLWSVATKEFLGEDGRVAGLRCVQAEWSPGPDGHPRFRELPGTEFIVAAQLVLLALGFTGASRDLLPVETGLRRTPTGALWTDSRHMTSLEGVFAAGDAAAGASLVVKAIADGRATALSMIEYLEHMPALRPQERDA
jgi:glutamate synthase (NADPH/NADH) small chain